MARGLRVSNECEQDLDLATARLWLFCVASFDTTSRRIGPPTLLDNSRKHSEIPYRSGDFVAIDSQARYAWKSGMMRLGKISTKY